MLTYPATVAREEKTFGVVLGLGVGFLVLSLVFVRHAIEMAFAAGGSFGLVIIAPLALGAWIGKLVAGRGYFRRVGRR